MGKLQYFEIIFDHKHGVYKAGDLVKGQVHVHLSEPMKMKMIQLWCQGKSLVHWSKTRRAGKHSHLVAYRSYESYFDAKVILAGSEDGEITLAAGQHMFDFEIPLADNLPSSFEGCYGFVRYVSKATICKPWKFDYDTKSAFTVISHLDLNREPMELKPRIFLGSSDFGEITVACVTEIRTSQKKCGTAMVGADSSDVSCCCCFSGRVSAEFSINRRGFVPGESVIINAVVYNNSNTTVNATRVSIKQYIEYTGETNDSYAACNETKTESKYVASKQRGAIKPRCSDKWENVPLTIPALPPSRLVGCNIINISYVIKFYVAVSYGEEIKLACKIIIGTVPLYETVAEFHPKPVVGETGLEVKIASDQPPVPILPTTDPEQSEKPTAPLIDIPTPEYEQCLDGPVQIRDEQDTDYTRGTLQWAPSYPFYRSFSVEDTKLLN